MFFKDGELVDAQFDQLSGLQAICVAFAQPPSSFNFNPLIKPYRRSIDSSLQKAVSEFLGCWDENAIDVEKSIHEFERRKPVAPILNDVYPTPPAENYQHQLPEAKALLALPPAPYRSRYSPSSIAMAAAGIFMLGVSAFISVNRGVVTSASTASPPVAATVVTKEAPTQPTEAAVDKAERPIERQHSDRTRAAARETVATTKEKENNSDISNGSTEEPKASEEKAEVNTSETSAVKVVLQVENGRVTQAAIGNSKAGMEAYEALALRIARQRRFPATSSGQQTVMIKVNQ
jgi:hypothetical protein